MSLSMIGVQGHDSFTDPIRLADVLPITTQTLAIHEGPDSFALFCPRLTSFIEHGSVTVTPLYPLSTSFDSGQNLLQTIHAKRQTAQTWSSNPPCYLLNPSLMFVGPLVLEDAPTSNGKKA
jgi:hypothetical protein